LNNSLQITIYLLVASVLFSFFAGLITKNYSHTDRLWSILPPVYVLIWMKEFYTNPRYVIGAIIVIAWGIRLSWNFKRRGGFNFSWKKGFYGEDYRWEVMRKKINNPFLYELFNFFFISLFQLVLIFFFTLPMYFVGKVASPLSVVDYFLFSLNIIILLIETISDNQQFSFNLKKRSPEFKDDKRYSVGFNTFGLWKYSRHPNYASEMSQWVVVWLYACFAYSSFHWSGVGVLTLILLFVGSTKMTEAITESKYPLFKNWKKACSPWVPFLDLPFRLKQRKKFFEQLEK